MKLLNQQLYLMIKIFTTLIIIVTSFAFWAQTESTNLLYNYSLPGNFSDYTFTQLSGTPTKLNNPTRIVLSGSQKARLSNTYSFPNTYDSIIVSYSVALNSGLGATVYPNISGNPISLTGAPKSVSIKKLSSDFSIDIDFRSNNQGGEVKISGLYIIGYKTNTTGVKDFEEIIETFKLFPNPSSGEIAIEVTNIDLDNSEVKILDLIGKEVYASNLSYGLETNIDLSNQKEGIYIVQLLKNGKLIQSEKLVIVK